MCILTKQEIIEERDKGMVIIEPFTPENLAPNSYDVTIGEWYVLPRKDLPSQVVLFQDNMWERPQKTTTGFIPVPARATILAHTREAVGGVKYITTEMKCRSTVGRSLLAVCKCAGWGDVGFRQVWTMEITNFSDSDILIPVGSRVAQIVFFRTKEVPPEDEYRGQYEAQEWTPEMMLPLYCRQISLSYEKYPEEK